MSAADPAAGLALQRFAAQLYPICRSITGAGVRQTLRLIGERVPLTMREVPSGTKVFDWEVPLEWNVEDASLSDANGRKVVDFREHNLHLMSYSEPVRKRLSLEELRPHLYSIPEHPDWIPYRTSYYKRAWGFCLRDRDLARLAPGEYYATVATSLAPGSLTYGECVLRGSSSSEVLIFTHVCHPSLANDNCAGIAVATALAQWLAGAPRRFTYRIVFAPGTIGSLCWLKANEARLGRVAHGLVLGLLGDPAPLTYKASRRGDCEIDRVAAYVLADAEFGGRTIEFEPYGYDERQLCSPGFDLPVGRLTRSVNGGYPQYHTSADDLDLVRPEALAHSLEACKRIVSVLEDNRRWINRSPKGEPRLGKRGLYGSVGGRSPGDRERAMLWILNQSDGTRSLLDIARRSALSFGALAEAAGELSAAGLLRTADGPRRAQARGTSRRKGVKR
jgi:aminopeptidase-like protein